MDYFKFNRWYVKSFGSFQNWRNCLTPTDCLTPSDCIFPAESNFPQPGWLSHLLPAAGSHVWKADWSKWTNRKDSGSTEWVIQCVMSTQTSPGLYPLCFPLYLTQRASSKYNSVSENNTTKVTHRYVIASAIWPSIALPWSPNMAASQTAKLRRTSWRPLVGSASFFSHTPTHPPKIKWLVNSALRCFF